MAEISKKPFPVADGGVLQDDLIVNILLRIPVRSLIPLKRVCKSWRFLILDPKFIQLHFNRNKSYNQGILFFGFKRPMCKNVSLFRVNKNLLTLFEADCSATRKSENPFEINFSRCFREMIPAGSVNGIICLSYYNRTAAAARFVVLWNPAINQWKPIRVPSPKLANACTSVGLGFDSVANDYMIIRLVYVNRESSRCWVEIYSANRDAWYDVSEGAQIPFSTIRPVCSFIVKGVPVWTGTYENNDRRRAVLGAFDPCTGLYKEAVYPSFVQNEFTCVHAVNLMDSVGALVQCPGETPNQMIDVYVLDESFTSWTNKYTIQSIPFQIGNIWWYQCFIDISGEIIVLLRNDGEGEKTAFIDPKNGGLLSTMGIDDLKPRWRESYNHVESLLRINGMKPIVQVD